MALVENYIYDLLKSQSTPLLLELSQKDLKAISKDPLLLANSVYSNKENHTNIIFIDANKVEDQEFIYLLQELLKLLKPQIETIQNIEIVKKIVKSGVSFASSGLLTSVFDGLLDSVTEFIIDYASGDLMDACVDYSLNHINVNTIQEILNYDTSIDIKTRPLFLSKTAQDVLKQSSKVFKKNLVPAELFNLILNLLINVTLDAPKLLYIKNPHKLDKDSLAILSLLLSFSKNAKEENKHTGLSIAYIYEDLQFQPYMEVEERYKESKNFLDEQRIFAQRYAMLERPNSDIPQIAVKSSMFVGRVEELNQLNYYYENAKRVEKETIFTTISGEPGIGKTKLVKKHLQQVRKREINGTKQIHLTLFNQVGHTSTNTGLASLIDSIIKEATRLETLKTWSHKAEEYIADTTLNVIKNILSIDSVIDIGSSIMDSATLNRYISQTQTNAHGNLDNKSTHLKEEQFRKVTKAIRELKKLSNNSMKIVLFVDDLQWIDEESAEYIFEHLSKVFNLYVVATLRPSDATTTLKQATKDEDSNLYKIALLKREIVQTNIDIGFRNIKLRGLDKKTLTTLISPVIDGEKAKHEILADSIIKNLNNTQTNDEVNTLFAIETINMLCDEKLYLSQEEKIEPLILNNKKFRFNPEIKNFEDAIEQTFMILEKKYQDAFESIDVTEDQTEFKQKFNLMTYAVLEERMNILKIYFSEYGNAAVNTLLFSSLLGTPFNSTIVKNVLEELAKTQEPLLQPLKEYILKDNHITSLTEIHYEIIEEVYEILSRYIRFDNTYEYRHSLFSIFLEKQLEYMLNNIFKEQKIHSKNKLYELVLWEIDEIISLLQGNYFEENLEEHVYENILVYKETEYRIIKKAFENQPELWVENFISFLDYISDLYNNKPNLAIQFANEALAIRKRFTVKDDNYLNNINILGYLYRKKNKQDIAIKLIENHLSDYRKLAFESDLTSKKYIENIILLSSLYSDIGLYLKSFKINKLILKNLIKLFRKKPFEWLDLYVITLENLAVSYKKYNKKDKEIQYRKKALSTLEEFYLIHNVSIPINKLYIEALLRMASTYFDYLEVAESIQLEEKALMLIVELYRENPSIYTNLYIQCLNNLSKSYKHINQFEKAIDLDKIAFFIAKDVYSYNSNIWISEYIQSSLSLVISYKTLGLYDEAKKILHDSLEIIQQKVEDGTFEWIETYVTIISELSEIYQEENIDKAIFLEKKAFELTKLAYNENSNRWNYLHFGSIINLGILYKANKQIYTAIEIEEEALKIVDELEKSNKTIWQEYRKSYLIILVDIADIYHMETKHEKAIALYKKVINLFDIYKIQDDKLLEYIEKKLILCKNSH